MCVCLCEFVCYVYAGALRGQKRASDCLALELQMVMTNRGIGNQTQVLCRNSWHPHPLSRLCSPSPHLLWGLSIRRDPVSNTTTNRIREML